MTCAGWVADEGARAHAASHLGDAAKRTQHAAGSRQQAAGSRQWTHLSVVPRKPKPPFFGTAVTKLRGCSGMSPFFVLMSTVPCTYGGQQGWGGDSVEGGVGITPA